MNIATSALVDYKTHFDRIFAARLPSEQTTPENLHRAIRYAALNGGKRIRPCLVYATGTICGVPQNICDNIACAIEAIHCYSLVHDDLPAMDNDDLRRGQPTCHIAFDEATAILVGDALQAFAFEQLARSARLALPAQLSCEMILQLAEAIGSQGMVGGQAIDINAPQNSHTQNITSLTQMHQMKTGALIQAAVNLTATASTQAAPAVRDTLAECARHLGLAFQIQDDILDVTGNTVQLGKQQGADAKHAKVTYVSLLGLAAAQQKLNELHQKAQTLIAHLPGDTLLLEEISNIIVLRHY